MKTIKFSRNWNGKLNNRVFTTIRKEQGDGYYSEKVGDIFNVILENRAVFVARLISARVMPFKDIPAEIMALDTGRTDMNEAMGIFQAFYGNNFSTSDKFYILLFERQERKEGGVNSYDDRQKK